jgi:hypothetical protein
MHLVQYTWSKTIKKTKKKKNNNEHKQDTIEIEGREILTYGCISSIIASWRENLLSQTTNTPQYSLSIFVITFKITNINKSEKSPLEYQQGIDLKKLIPYQLIPCQGI